MAQKGWIVCGHTVMVGRKSTDLKETIELKMEEQIRDLKARLLVNTELRR